MPEYEVGYEGHKYRVKSETPLTDKDISGYLDKVAHAPTKSVGMGDLHASPEDKVAAPKPDGMTDRMVKATQQAKITPQMYASAKHRELLLSLSSQPGYNKLSAAQKQQLAKRAKAIAGTQPSESHGSITGVPQEGVIGKVGGALMSPFNKLDEKVVSGLLSHGIGQKEATDAYSRTGQSMYSGSFIHQLAPKADEAAGSLPAGVGGLYKSASGIASPGNAAIGAATGGLGLLGKGGRVAQRAISGVFAVGMVKDAHEGIQRYRKTGDINDLTQAVGSGVLGLAAAGHATGAIDHIASKVEEKYQNEVVRPTARKIMAKDTLAKNERKAAVTPDEAAQRAKPMRKGYVRPEPSKPSETAIKTPQYDAGAPLRPAKELIEHKPLKPEGKEKPNDSSESVGTVGEKSGKGKEGERLLPVDANASGVHTEEPPPKDDGISQVQADKKSEKVPAPDGNSERVPDKSGVSRVGIVGKGGSEEASSSVFTGARKAITEKEAVDAGLNPVDKQAYRSVQQGLDAGIEAINNHEIDPRHLAESVSKNPTNLNDTQIGALTHDRFFLKSEMDKMGRALDNAIESGDKPEIERLQAKYNEHSKLFDTNTEALQKGGRENSIALQAMKMVLYDETSPTDVISRVERYSGKKLKPEEAQAWRHDVERYKEAVDAVGKVPERLAQKRAEDALKVVQKRTTRSQKRTDVKVEREKVGAQIREALKQSMKHSADPFGAGAAVELVKAAPLVGKYGRLLAQELGYNLADVTDRVKQDFKEHNLTDRFIHDAISGYGHKAEPRPQSAGAQKLSGLKKEARLLSQIDDVKKQIDAGTKDPQAAKTPAQKNALEQQLSDLRKQLNGIDSNNKAPERQQKVTDALKDKLAQEKAGVDTRKPSTLRQVSEEDKTLRRQISEERRLKDVQAQIAEMSKATAPGGDTTPFRVAAEERKAKAEERKSRLEQNAALSKAIADRDYLRNKLRIKMEAEKPLTGLQKAVLYSRFAKLTRIGTLLKLGGATVSAIPVEALADVIGAGVGAVRPGLRSIADREGRFYGKSIPVQLKGLVSMSKADVLSAISKDDRLAMDKMVESTALGNAIRAFKTGSNKVYGVTDKASAAGGALDKPGHLHAAEKSFLQTSEFRKSQYIRMRIAQERGLDITKPEIAEQVMVGAAYDASRIILQSDSPMAKQINAAFQQMDTSHSATVRVVGALAHALTLPIVKVPLNYIGKATDLTGAGFLHGAAIEANLKLFQKRPPTPDEANAIFRAYKYGGVGLVAMYIGLQQPAWWKASGFYGYQQHGNKDKEGKELDFGGMEIGGAHIPHILAHNPFFEAIQFWSTVRRAHEGKHSDSAEEFGDIAKQGAGGMIRQLPGLESADDLIKASTGSDRNSGAALGGLARDAIVPGLVQEGAAGAIPGQQKTPLKGDVDAQGSTIKRTPRGVRESVKMGLPYYRKQVPEKGSTRRQSADPTSEMNRAFRMP